MPYGLPKNLDTEENNKWMERCVGRVMRDGDKTKGNAIAICKAQLIKTRGNKSAAYKRIMSHLGRKT